MGVVSLQLGAVLQSPATDVPARQPAANVTPINANQAQAAPVPQDTVTLTGQAAQGQQAQQDQQNQQQQPAFQQANLFGANARLPPPDPASNAAPQEAVAQPAPQQPAPAPAKFPPGNSANAAGGNASGNTAQTPAQQLQVLDQTLEQLGINPSSISLSDRMALLGYASDPAALEQFVAQIEGNQASGQAAAAPNQTPAQAQNQPPAQAAAQGTTQGSPPAQGQDGDAPPLSAANQATADADPATPNPQPATPATDPLAQLPANPANNTPPQFQEFQLTFAAIGGQSQASPPTLNSNPNQGGQLNVVV